MKIEFPGKSKEDLIPRCGECDWCIFEYILRPEQRKIKVLDKLIPRKHIHRDMIEQLCGKNYDEVCAMKYAVMRVELDAYTAAQVKAIEIYSLDLAKEQKQEITFDAAAREWTREGDMGRGKLESFAQRFRDVYNLASRKNNGQEDLILSTKGLYEITVAGPGNYETLKKGLKGLKQEHFERPSR